jgi:small GTP-binding protein
MDERDQLLRELDGLYRSLTVSGDSAAAEKARALYEKCREGTFYLALCGHFSAGKSSLINKLCGAALLPSSPIPTSANIVTIRSGATGASIVYRDGKTARVEIDEVAQYAKNGQEVESVELRHPIPLLGEHAALLDTPGVDSTDEAHQMATEAALHLADAVMYVMDYNHVLSEMNLEFAKRLADLGKPLVLVVNQIDKHRSEEVAFETFREGVTDAFASWGIEPVAVFFTTMKAPEHPQNQLGLLRSWLRETVRSGEALALRGVAKSAIGLTEEHREYLADENEERKRVLREQLATEEAEADAARFEALSGELNRREEARGGAVEKVRAEAGRIAENANITPAATRDLAQAFLESLQPGFKVGFLFAGAKTEEEKKRRLEAFRTEFQTNVTAQLVWHVRDSLRKLSQELGIAGDEAGEAAIESVDAAVAPEWLVGMVRSGAGATGEYTLNYCKEIAAEVRLAVRKAAVAAAEAMIQAAASHGAAEEDELRSQLAELETRLADRRELEGLEAAESDAAQQLAAGLACAAKLARERPAFPEVSRLQTEPWEANAAAPEAAGAVQQAAAAPLSLAVAAAHGGDEAERTGAARSPGGARSFHARLEAAADTLDAASGVVERVAPLAGAARALKDKARRLREQRFTAALFGAFSAGKSSFANALLGESALPVSPNPTTASINTVVPPEPEEWPHDTARVLMKTREAIVQDIEHSAHALGIQIPAGGIDGEYVRKTIDKFLRREGKSIPPSGKPHLAFLRAVAQGWAEAESMLGGIVKADREQFRAYVAEEAKSAFVDRIELFYESPLAKQGVTLVDTPGADSINARHTGVAFNYIKNADAIFFVTYYNHAFSRADRQFLEQLGRVKEAFELDKMFFIVNAADLASSQEELQDVLDHVRDNLAAFGIRSPRLFPVSSLTALQAKASGSRSALEGSGMAAFEDAFERFASLELAGLVYRSAEGELKRAAGLLHSLIDAANTGEAERSEALAKLDADESAARELIETSAVDAELRMVEKEIAEQFYYIKQRFTFRFGEWFAASFNPSTLREDRGEIKQALEWAWRDLVEYVRKELVNEALAVTVRMDNFLNRSLSDFAERGAGEIRKRLPSFETLAWEKLNFTAPQTEEVWSGEEPDLKLMRGHYRSSKLFFEGNGRKELKEALEKRWSQPIAEALEAEVRHFTQWYQEQLQLGHREIMRITIGQIGEAAGGIRAALAQSWDLGDLEARSNQLQTMLETLAIDENGMKG